MTTSTSPMSNKRSHKSNVTQPRLIKTKLEEVHSCLFNMMLLRTLEIPLNLTTRSLLTARTAWTFRNHVIPLVVLPLETLFKHHVLSVVATTGSEESVRIVQATTSGWIVTRLGFPGAKVRRTTRDGAEGWIVEQPLRKPLQWSKWFGSRRHGVDAATEAAQCKTNWDLEDSKAFLVRGDSSVADSSELLYSLDKTRKCGELEAAGLLCGDSSEGRAECVRRQIAANFNGRVQQCDGGGDENNIMESQSTDHLAIPPQSQL